MDLSDELRIETPEQIDLEFELAGLGTRTASWLCDALIKWLITFVSMIVLVATLGFLDVKSGDGDFGKFAGAFIAMLVAFFWTIYDIIFEMCWNGQTPGKRIMGSRVVRDGGSPVDFTSSCIRNFLAVADFLPIGYLFGALMIALTSKRQRLGDIAAGTLVIRERQTGVPVQLDARVGELANADITFTASQLARCTANDRRILRSFVTRIYQMPPAARFKLAMELSATLHKRMQMPPLDATDGTSAVAWLASLLRDINRKVERGY